MDADASDREREIEARIAALDLRLRQIETRLGLQTQPARDVNPPPSTTAASRPSVTAAPRDPAVLPLPEAAPPYWSSEARARSLASQSHPAGPTGWPTSEQLSARGPTVTLGASLRDLEERLTGRALAWIGGLALVLGVGFLLSLAFSRGWIGPEHRVLIGLVGGAVFIVGGAGFMERGNRLLGHVLTPVGLAFISISLVGATRLYDLIPVGVGLVLALGSAIAAAVIATRGNSPTVAAFGLVSVLAAPPLLDAPADLSTLAFVGVVLVGTTAVAVWRTWAWLPAIAFLLAAPQAAAWIGREPDPALAMAGLSVFAALNVVAAGGEEFRRRCHELSGSSATLMVANAAFLVWAGFAVLDGDLEIFRGGMLIAAAMAQSAVGAAFVARDGERNLFGLLSLGTGIALLTMAVPAQLGASAVPIAWTAEAVVLTWLAVLRGHPYSAFAATILYLLAAGDVIWVNQSAARLGTDAAFFDGAGVSLAFFAAGVVAGVWLLRDLGTRSALAALGLVSVAWCVAERLEGGVAVAALSALAAIGIVTMRLLPELPTGRIQWQTEGLIPRSMASLDDWRPLLDRAIAATVPVVAGAALIELSVDPRAREYAWSAVVAWTLLGAGPMQLLGPDTAGRNAYRLAALTGMAAAAITAVTVVAPPTRLAVGAAGVEPIVAIETALALAVVAAAVAVLARSAESVRLRRWLWIGAGIVAVHLLSVAAVDAVATQVGRGIAFDELRTQGQVALSVTWAGAGVVGFVAGLRLRIPDLRQGGLGLLGLATLKVFVFDLSALEIAYRVISLIVLGLLLLASAWVWQRLQPRPEREAVEPPS